MRADPGNDPDAILSHVSREDSGEPVMVYCLDSDYDWAFFRAQRYDPTYSPNKKQE